MYIFIAIIISLDRLSVIRMGVLRLWSLCHMLICCVVRWNAVMQSVVRQCHNAEHHERHYAEYRNAECSSAKLFCPVSLGRVSLFLVLWRRLALSENKCIFKGPICKFYFFIAGQIRTSDLPVVYQTKPVLY